MGGVGVFMPIQYLVDGAGPEYSLWIRFALKPCPPVDCCYHNFALTGEKNKRELSSRTRRTPPQVNEGGVFFRGIAQIRIP
jgi:hypothetical protein